MAMRALVIGTGYLGRAVKDRLERGGMATLHTFNRHQIFPDSVRFDIFSQCLADVIDIGQVDTVVVTSKTEDNRDTEAVLPAMERLFKECKGKRVVYLSSDAVFDGRRGMYSEQDHPAPITRYGKCKALCESLLRDHVVNHCIVRPNYIYGYSLGQLDPRLSDAIKTILSGRPYARYVDMFKSPVDVGQLVEIVALLLSSDFRGVLHAPGMRMSIYAFFRESLEALKIDTRLLLPMPVPENKSPECLVDTSLDCTLAEAVLGILPISPAQALHRAKLELS